MTIAPLVMSALSALLHENAEGKFESTINNESPLLGSGALEVDEDQEGGEWTHEVFVGAHQATSFVVDYGNRPKGSAFTPIKARALPVLVTSTFSMGLAASMAKLSDKGLSKLFASSLDAVADDCARHLTRGILGGSISPNAGATWTGILANSTVTVAFLDVSLFKPNASYDFDDLDLGFTYVVRCTAVTPAAVGANSINIAGNVSFINDVVNPATNAPLALGSTTVATGDIFRLRGNSDGFGQNTSITFSNAITSFDKIAGSGASTATVHGIAPGIVPSWIGHTQAMASAAYSQEAILAVMMRVQTYGGKMPTHMIYSPQAAAAHAASPGVHGAVFGVSSLAVTAETPRTVDRSADKYGNMSDGHDSGLRIGGKPIIIEPNQPATTITGHNSDTVKLACWKKMGPEQEGENSLFVNRTTASVESYITGLYELTVQKRQTVMTVTGLGSL